MTQTLQYADLSALLSLVGYAEDPAECHGTLCGTLCVLAPEEVELASLLELGESEPVKLSAETRRALQSLCNQTYDALTSSEMAFEPLLPDDDAPLAERSVALSAWCQGFLFGLASGRTLNLKQLSEEAREIVQDLTQFTQAGLSADDDQEIEETAYAELVEYVRVGAQLLFLELRPRGGDDDEDESGRPTLH